MKERQLGRNIDATGQIPTTQQSHKNRIYKFSGYKVSQSSDQENKTHKKHRGIYNRFKKASLFWKILLAVVVIFLLLTVSVGATAILTIKNEPQLQQVPIIFTTQSIEDETTLAGQVEIVTQGVNGIKELTYDVKKILGITTSKKLISTETIKEPIAQVEKRGIIEVSEVTTTEPVPFDKTTQQSTTGRTYVLQNGADGVRTKTYTVQLLRGQEISRVLSSEAVTTQPKPQITAIGKTTCIDVTSYDYNWYNDMLCTRPDGSRFYTNYAGARAATQ